MLFPSQCKASVVRNLCWSIRLYLLKTSRVVVPCVNISVPLLVREQVLVTKNISLWVKVDL